MIFTIYLFLIFNFYEKTDNSSQLIFPFAVRLRTEIFTKKKSKKNNIKMEKEKEKKNVTRSRMH